MVFKIGREILFHKKSQTMKKYLLSLFVIVMLFFSCKNEKNTTASNSTSTPSATAPTKEEPTLVTESAMDFWTKRKCTRGIPKPIVNEAQKGEGYSFELDKIRGRSIEKVDFDKGDQVTITNKGCESIWLVYSYVLNSEVHELDLEDKLAVSKKLLSLVEFASKLSTPPLELKGRLPMLNQVIDQIGPFEVGQEFLFSDESIKEGFTLYRVEKKGGKLLLDFSFSMGPL